MSIPDPTPSFLIKFHFIAMVIAIVLVIPTLLWWKESILWIGLMSIYAVIVGHFSAWDAARAEQKVDAQ